MLLGRKSACCRTSPVSGSEYFDRSAARSAPTSWQSPSNFLRPLLPSSWSLAAQRSMRSPGRKRETMRSPTCLQSARKGTTLCGKAKRRSTKIFGNLLAKASHRSTAVNWASPSRSRPTRSSSQLRLSLFPPELKIQTSSSSSARLTAGCLQLPLGARSQANVVKCEAGSKPEAATAKLLRRRKLPPSASSPAVAPKRGRPAVAAVAAPPPSARPGGVGAMRTVAVYFLEKAAA
mmetsp:Transcript_38040/g.80882  ORF Transcript_38040/g.80882 Transcript_38040/m.80882 type:complete len:234 (-) Transcript_38040:803-1504(-)